jgi:L-amino acid N-acyltransferase YncA
MRPGARVTAYRLRLATASDAEAICRIYNEGIEDRVATLETELRTPDERRQWLASRSPRHPVIVAEITDQSAAPEIGRKSVAPEIGRESSAPEIGRVGATSSSVRPPSKQAGLTDPATIIAWASLNVFNAREAYRFVADISVYVERSWRGKGAGGVLLEKLVELGRQHGFHKLVLAAFPSNTGGMALYEKLGFRTVGIYREQGMLDGKWVDTIVMERLL